MRNLHFLSILLASFLACSIISSCGKNSPQSIEKQNQNREIEKIENEKLSAMRKVVESLPLEERVNQLFMVNIDGGGGDERNTREIFTPIEYRDGEPLIPGSFIFFYFNISDEPEKIIKFTDSVADYCREKNKIMPFLALDQEGGLVARLRRVSAKLPAAIDVAQNVSLEDAYQLYEMQGKQMRALGFTMNLAPVIEPLTESNMEFLESRSYGTLRDTENYGAAALIGFQSSGVAGVLKHFPGNTNTDPHSGLPNITLTKDEFNAEVIEPFSSVFQYEPAAILMSHALTQNIDPKTPACLSSIWINDVLRTQMKYDGLVVSDDIFMAALAENGYPPEVASVKAIEAGVDIIMITEKEFISSADILIQKANEDEKFAKRIFDSCVRVLLAKEKYGVLQIPESERNKGERLIEFLDVRGENVEFNKLHF